MKKIVFLLLILLIGCSSDFSTEKVLEGFAMETEVHYYDTGKPGKRVAIIGGIHGDELAGWKAADMINDNLKEYFKTGVVMIIPHANELSIQEERRYVEGYTDLNRTFLGEGDENSVQLSAEIKKLVTDFKPDIVLDHHESLDSYMNGRLGNTIIVSDVKDNVFSALEIVDIINEVIVDDLDFIIESNPPEGSFNKTLSEELSVLVITIETNRKLELEKRIEEQLLVFESIMKYISK